MKGNGGGAVEKPPPLKQRSLTETLAVCVCVCVCVCPTDRIKSLSIHSELSTNKPNKRQTL